MATAYFAAATLEYPLATWGLLIAALPRTPTAIRLSARWPGVRRPNTANIHHHSRWLPRRTEHRLVAKSLVVPRCPTRSGIAKASCRYRRRTLQTRRSTGPKTPRRQRLKERRRIEGYRLVLPIWSCRLGDQWP